MNPSKNKPPDSSAWVKAAKEGYREEMERIKDMHFGGAGGTAVVKANTEATERLVKSVFNKVLSETGTEGRDSGWTLLAVGGFGRGELNPYSDVDIMFLCRDGMSASERKDGFATRNLHLLWDLGLDLGYSVRSASDCAGLVKQDFTIMTSLLEARYLCGDRRIADEFARKMGESRRPKAVEEYIREKLTEKARRHKKYGDSIFLREPNIKEGAGGLRDIHAAFWIARIKYGVSTSEGLVEKGLIKEAGLRRLKRSKDYLLRLRNELHYLAGHKQDVLTFDHQEKAAVDFGYTPRPNRMAVENFMRAYYLRARGVSDLAQGIIEKSLDRPKLSWLSLPSSKRRVGGGFYVMGRSLCLDREMMDVLPSRPELTLSAFSQSQRQGVPMSENLCEAIAANVTSINKKARESLDAGRAFMDMMGRPEDLYETLNQMHRMKVLGRFLPEFGAVSALVQHDLYHRYTVDEHSLLAVRRLQSLLGGEGMACPEFREAFFRVKDRQVLFLATLMHDTGKAKGSGHAEIGARLTGRAATRLGLDEARADTAEFLVRNHLIMSHVSQRRELSDPRVIEKFCRIVESPERLDMLFLLTYADLSSVGPDIFNDWRRTLLKDLYDRAGAFLRDKVSVIAYDKARLAELKKATADKAAKSGIGKKEEVTGFIDNLPPRYLLYTPPETVLRHFTLSRGLKPTDVVIDHMQNEGGYTDLTIILHEVMGLFSMTAGALAARNMNILSAQIYTGKDGMVVDTFQVTDCNKKPELDETLWGEVSATLMKVLTGRKRVEDMLPNRPAYPKRTSLKDVPARVVFDNEASDRFTVIEVFAPDRVGLLYDITRTLYQNGCYVSSAKVDTEVDQVVDVFYVSDIFKQKIEDAGRITAIKEALTRAVGGDGR